MHDLAFVVFLMALIAIGFRRPFVFVLTYVYIDNVAPQRLTYYLLNSIPISLITFGLAVLAWMAVDNKRDVRVAPRQALLLILLIYCGITTTQADFPLQAAEKWGWVWKALVFAIFLPLTLRTRLRFEALALFMTLSAGTIIIVGGIKTVVSGGGYGSLNLMVNNNIGLYEGSIISAIAITIIPLLLFLMREGTIFQPDWRVKLFGHALIFACLLMPIGTQARTGLICIGVLALLLLRSTQRRVLYLSLMAGAALIAVPLLPSSFTNRMDTIKGYKADQSASTRIAVWAWTWDYAKDHPFGGGFDAFRQNKLRFELTETVETGATGDVESRIATDKARAYHSAYFEMLGEQGYPGLLVWLIIHITGLARMELLHRRYAKRDVDSDQWIGGLATALQQAHIIYLVGALFVGIAFNPFVYMLVGMQIGLDTYASRREAESAWKPIRQRRAQPI
jgi:probable O-glycosylation ligase (exosortase A-associated)